MYKLHIKLHVKLMETKALNFVPFKCITMISFSDITEYVFLQLCLKPLKNNTMLQQHHVGIAPYLKSFCMHDLYMVTPQALKPLKQLNG